MATWNNYLRTQAQPAAQTWRAALSSRPSWSATAAPRARDWANPGGSSSSRTFTPSATKAAAYTAAGPPQRFDFSLPFSPATTTVPQAPAPPQPSTKGDILGSIGGAIGSMSGLNIANAIPYLLERTHELANGVADATKDVPGVGFLAGGARDLTGRFVDGLEAVSNVVAPVMDAIPNWTRDQQLTGRQRLYQQAISGQPAEMFTPSTAADRHLFGQYFLYQKLLASSSGVDKQHQAAMFADAIDLPESVKKAIADAPGASPEQLDKIMSAAPEGRQWSYQPGTFSNMIYPMLYYGAEAVALNAVGGTALSVGRAAGGLTGTAISGAARVTSVAAQIQRAAFVSGATTTALTTAMEGISRYQGDQAAIDWLDKVSQPGEFANNPNVQLVTGFSVNPFEGAGALAKGTLKLASGTGNIVLNRTLGTKLLRYYTSDTMIYDQMAKMHRMDSGAEFRAWNDANGFYANKGEMFDEVVGLAADHVLAKLPSAERLQFLATHNDPIARTKGVLSTYGAPIMDALTNAPDAIAQRWFGPAWAYHGYAGSFDVNVAAKNAQDYRGAVAQSYEFRARKDAVVGYQDYINPTGQGIVRQMIDAMPDTIPVGGLGGIDGLIENFPAMQKYWQGLIEPGATTVPKSVVETMLQRAADDYSTAFKLDPTLVRTGASPVIRPNSPRVEYDYADALGTNVETVRAISEYKSGAPSESVDRMRTFLTEKTGLDPTEAAAMAPDTVWERASTFMETTTQPWVDAGTRVVAAEKQMDGLRSDLRRLHALGDTRRTSTTGAEIARIEQELAGLQTLTGAATDPIRTFSEDIRVERIRSRQADRIRGMDEAKLTAKDAKFLREYVSDGRSLYVAADVTPDHLLELAREKAAAHPSLTGRDAYMVNLAERKVGATVALRELDSIDGQVANMQLPGGSTGWTGLVRKVEGEWTWSGGKPPMSTALRKSVAQVMDAKGKWYTANEVLLMGDEEAWSLLLRDHPEIIDSLTRNQQRYVRRMQLTHEGLGGQTLDLNAEHLTQAGEITQPSQLVGRLGALADQRAAILDGARNETFAVRNLERTAGVKVPSQIERQAAADLDPQSVMFDAEYESVTHPANLAELGTILDNPAELYPAMAGLAEKDYRIANTAWEIADRHGVDYAAVLRDPVYAPEFRSAIPDGFEPPVPGVVTPLTELDDLIAAGDRETIAARSESLREAASQPHPPVPTTRSAAQAAAQRTVRKSSEMRRRLVSAGADMHSAPSAAILNDPANLKGLDTLSVLNHGHIGTTPATLGGTVDLLREIENGGGNTMGLGAGMQAEAQRVANLILHDGLAVAKRRGFDLGELGPGLDAASLGELDHEIALTMKVNEARSVLDRTLQRDAIAAGKVAESQAANVEVGVLRGGTRESGRAVKASPALQSHVPPAFGGIEISYEAGDPLGSLQYTLKKRPKDAVVMELAQVPGLAEEFVAKRFVPWNERVWTAQTRHLFNYVFGAHSNEAIHGVIHQTFIERMARAGIDGEAAESVWTRWRKEADASRKPEERIDRKTGARTSLPGDNPLYASVANIPNARMNEWAREAINATLDARLKAGLLDPRYRALAQTINYSQVFRESSSNMRRWLLGESVQIGSVNVPSPVRSETLGKSLAGAYGLVAHNEAVTTLYYQFRFALDVRFHAMNYFESQLLYTGRAGLRRGEIDTGMFGMTEARLRHLDTDPTNNTGYATGRARFDYVYRTFLKEQPDAIRKGLQAEDPRLMDQALRELADFDPQLHDMIVNAGGGTDAWMKAMNDWYGRMLDTATDAEGNAVIDLALATEIEKTPALAEVYGALAQVNKDLWTNARSTFYGNPNRSRAERFLNSYLLYWPLSYQIKATKWMLRIMYDRAGGLPTNAAGAVILNRVAQSHQQLLATDAKYADWYEKHPTLVFLAQMLIPISPSSIGVSISPPLRALFFGQSKAIWDVGPIYTARMAPKLGAEVMTDLYPSLKDIPVINELAGGVYRMTTGRAVPGLDN